jgi:hypothetical protein
MVRRPAIRWGLVLVVALGLFAAGYWTVTVLSNTGVRYLASQRQFSSDDLIKVCRTLDKGRIPYRIDEQRRVEVAADQFDQADALVAKVDLGQHSIDEIRSESSESNIFATPSEREQKKELARERILERLIGQREGVIWSLVSIHRPRTPAWSQQHSKPSAFVYIETDGNRPLPYQTVQSIPAILAGFEPELTPGSITVMDRRGVRYFDAGDPALGDSWRNRAREEELSEEIAEKLDWIKGVRVQVQVTSPRATAATIADCASGATSKHPGATRSVVADRLDPATPRSDSSHSRPTMRLNQPLELEPVPQAVTRAPPPAAPAPNVQTGSDKNSLAGAQRRERENERGRVLVFVPSSFYLNADNRTDQREPSREDFHAMVQRTEKQIRAAVGLVIPESESWKVDVDTIPDKSSLHRSTVLTSASDQRRRYLNWRLVGGTLAAVSILAAAGSWLHLARRPARLFQSAQTGRRFHVDPASEPGPSERVRELIRSNPQAAASVLQRWVGQGIGVS